MSDATTKHALARFPVQTVRVDVVQGPDVGQACAAGECVTIGTARDNSLVLSDSTVSRYHVELRAQPEGVHIVDLGSTNGTFAAGLRVERAFGSPGMSLSVGKTQLALSAGPADEVELSPGDSLAGLRGRTPAMRRLMSQIERAARGNVATLISGESGTGKELVARALHESSPQRDNPFITVDCGALAPTLVASELFGHERGAFTGAAHQRVGAFEQAHGGTLFLDEIGELPRAVQATLLGALERKRFKRLGGRREIVVDVRVVSATNRDLRAEVNAGHFRLDLFYRLAVLRLHLPPLRERLDDLPLLLEHFARRAGHGDSLGVLLSESTLRQLREYFWPGNVRELKNFVEATLTMGEPVSLGDDPAAPQPQSSGGDLIRRLLPRPYREARSALLSEFESQYLSHLLSNAGDNVSKAARIAKMDRSHLIDLLRRHGLR